MTDVIKRQFLARKNYIKVAVFAFLIMRLKSIIAVKRIRIVNGMKMQRCFSRLLELLPLKNLSISSSKMFPDCLTMTQAGHLKQSSVHWMAWGIMCVGRYLTAKISEFPSQGISTSLCPAFDNLLRR